jgi:hypothetical protein
VVAGAATELTAGITGAASEGVARDGAANEGAASVGAASVGIARLGTTTGDRGARTEDRGARTGDRGASTGEITVDGLTVEVVSVGAADMGAASRGRGASRPPTTCVSAVVVGLTDEDVTLVVVPKRPPSSWGLGAGSASTWPTTARTKLVESTCR